MPDYFPENDTVGPGDDKGRTLQKTNSVLYGIVGDVGPTCFPEGSRPLPGDSEERSQKKIDALLS